MPRIAPAAPPSAFGDADHRLEVQDLPRLLADGGGHGRHEQDGTHEHPGCQEPSSHHAPPGAGLRRAACGGLRTGDVSRYGGRPFSVSPQSGVGDG